MSKKHFIALANLIRDHNHCVQHPPNTSIAAFTDWQIMMLANFCESQNERFNRPRWLAYIAGTCGPNGGKVKP